MPLLDQSPDAAVRLAAASGRRDLVHHTCPDICPPATKTNSTQSLPSRGSSAPNIPVPLPYSRTELNSSSPDRQFSLNLSILQSPEHA